MSDWETAHASLDSENCDLRGWETAHASLDSEKGYLRGWEIE